MRTASKQAMRVGPAPTRAAGEQRRWLIPILLLAGVSAAANVPDDQQLVVQGAVIGHIRIDNQDVFDLDRDDENNALYRLANRWHYRTRKHLIADTLLFHTGEAYDPRLLEESARLLRSMRYLGDAKIEPVAYGDGKVDIEVTTRDVWSLNPGVSFGRKGGENDYGFELEELNLLGLGIELDLDYTSDVDRDGYFLGLTDRHAFGAHRRLEAGYGNFSDGTQWRFGYSQPFYALDVRHAWGLSSSQTETVDDVYQRGHVVDEYMHRDRQAEVFYGYSTGLRDGWVTRWTGGLSMNQQVFNSSDARTNLSPLPAGRDLRAVWVGFEAIQDDFRIWENRNQIGRTEDVLLGTHLSMRVGRALEALGGDRNSWLYSASFSRGFPLSKEKTLQVSADLDGRYEQGEVADLLLNTNLRYFHPLSERNLVFGKLSYSWGDNLSFDRRLLLGGDSGLRGFPLRYQAGDRRVLATVEQRYFTDWYPFRLFRVGFAAFADVGRTWGDDGLGTPNPGWLKDVGVGLRLGNTRSALGNVIHIDLATPIGAPADVDHLQILIEARREF